MPTLVQQYQTGLARTRQVTAAAVAQAWDDLGTYYEDSVEPFLDTITPIVWGAQEHAIALTDGFMALRTRRDPFGIGLDDLTDRLRNGVPLTEVYRRPFVTTWTALSKGAGVRDAISAGRARAVGSAEMDVALATRASAHEAMDRDDRVVAYERVPDGGACDFCLLASTQRYHSEDLMPLHNRCGCTVDPILRGDRRGKILDRDLLGDLKAKGVKVYRDGTVRTYGDKNSAVATQPSRAMKVEEHGELGPVVVNADDKFTDEHDI